MQDLVALLRLAELRKTHAQMCSYGSLISLHVQVCDDLHQRQIIDRLMHTGVAMYKVCDDLHQRQIIDRLMYRPLAKDALAVFVRRRRLLFYRRCELTGR